MIGTTLAHYKIIGLLGKGGMGEVYRARDLQLDRDVALKILPEGISDNDNRARRFEREAKMLASLEHPNISRVHGFQKDKGTLFIAMELVEGQTLSASISESGLPLDRFLEITIPLADAIAFAHDQGVMHRDLKPANIMLDSTGRIRVLDFGLAGLWQAPSDEADDRTQEMLTVEGQVMGTAGYMAPEQLEGRTVDARADVFAIGLILYELATGKKAFTGDSTASVASATLRDNPVPLEELRPDLPADLARVIRRCLEKKVERRLQTARDICNELRDLKDGIRTNKAPDLAATTTPSGSLAEQHLTITTEHVRELSTQIPRMVGDSMTYLDNEHRSDVLIICLHGIGSDQRDFEDFLRETPYRAVALSNYGFGPKAPFRPPLSFDDHNRLVTFLVEDLHQRISPQTLILLGHSSGSDQMLEVASSPMGERIHPDGLILLGPAVLTKIGLVSGPYSKMTDSKNDVFNTLRTISSTADDVDSWLILHDYLVQAFTKFSSDVTALQHFAETYISRIQKDVFFEQFCKATGRIDQVRCIFGKEDVEHSDEALKRHIHENALGEHYSEEMIKNVPVGHHDLAHPSLLLPIIEDIVRR